MHLIHTDLFIAGLLSKTFPMSWRFPQRTAFAGFSGLPPDDSTGGVPSVSEPSWQHTVPHPMPWGCLHGRPVLFTGSRMPLTGVGHGVVLPSVSSSTADYYDSMTVGSFASRLNTPRLKNRETSKRTKRKSCDNFISESDQPPHKVLVNEEKMAIRLKQAMCLDADISNARDERLSAHERLEEINSKLVLTDDEEEMEEERKNGCRLHITSMLKKSMSQANTESILPKKVLDEIKPSAASLQLMLWQPPGSIVRDIITSRLDEKEEEEDDLKSNQNIDDATVASEATMEGCDSSFAAPSSSPALSFSLSPEATNNNTLPSLYAAQRVTVVPNCSSGLMDDDVENDMEL